MFNSKNMSYIYYHEYFEGLEERKEPSGLVYELGGSPSSEEQFRDRNMALQDFKFPNLFFGNYFSWPHDRNWQSP